MDPHSPATFQNFPVRFSPSTLQIADMDILGTPSATIPSYRHAYLSGSWLQWLDHKMTGYLAPISQKEQS